MEKRIPSYPIESLILNRWSPRALSVEGIDDTTLMTLFEAARWAPSSYNGQPWLFLYAKRETPSWKSFFDLLVPFNQSWAERAAVLVVVCSRTHFAYNNEPSRTHSFDAGAACENLALQGHAIGLVVHLMEGFDYDKAAYDLNIPPLYSVQAMIALGKPGKIELLPKELQEREKPSDRKPLSSMVIEGKFKES